jgi:hypothetical protein
MIALSKRSIEMLSIRKSADHRVDIVLNGAVDAEMMRRGLDDLIALSEGVSGGQMLYTIPEFAMPTLGAIGVEFARLPELIGLLGKYDKCAVLSDAAWLRKTAEVEGALLPGLAIKGFALDDLAGAEAWLAEGKTA